MARQARLQLKPSRVILKEAGACARSPLVHIDRRHLVLQSRESVTAIIDPGYRRASVDAAAYKTVDARWNPAQLLVSSHRRCLFRKA